MKREKPPIESTNLVEIMAEKTDPAKWAALQIIKDGRPDMTCGEAMDMIEAIVNRAIELAMNRNTGTEPKQPRTTRRKARRP